MDYIPPHVDSSTPQVAEDNLTKDLTRICPLCYENWTGLGAQLIYHILQNHRDYMLQPEQNKFHENPNANLYNLLLLDNINQDSKTTDNEIVKIFIEHEKVFVIELKKLPDSSGFSACVNYIGPFIDKQESMLFTVLIQYKRNVFKLTSARETIGNTVDVILDDVDAKVHFERELSKWPVIIKVQLDVPKKFQEMIDALKFRLTCFRCGHLMMPPITQCRYGHIICRRCREKTPSRPSCPTCYHDTVYKEQHSKTDPITIKQDTIFSSSKEGNQCGGDLGSSDLRLLSEQALEIVYCCNGKNCQTYISCLDLSDHLKYCT